MTSDELDAVIRGGREGAMILRARGIEAVDPEEEAERALARADYERAMGWLGNEQRPACLWRWWKERRIEAPGLRQMILHAWDHGHRGGFTVLGENRWLALWHAAGFVSSDGSAPPTGELTVWRGALSWTGGRGFSWTLEQEQAKWFRDRHFRRGQPASLYRATVLPHQVLGIDHERREAEIIVNPRTLRGRRAPVVVGREGPR